MRLAIIAESVDDLLSKLEQATLTLKGNAESLADPRGVFYGEKPFSAADKIAFLFPGQGSQYVDMLAELCIQFPEIHDLFARADAILDDRLETPLSATIFPPQVFAEEEKKEQAKALARTTVAQPAMGCADLGLFGLWRELGVQPDMVAGHSYGEYVALAVAGVVTEDELISLSEARARFILQGAGDDPGTMAAVEAGVETVEKQLAGRQGVWVANINAPDQVVITGEKESVARTVGDLEKMNIKARQIPVSCAFHSPLVEPACRELATYLEGVALRTPQLPVFSNTSAMPYGKEPAMVRKALVRHLVSKVRFVEQINRMYEAGARIFVECGPGRVLSGLTGKILADRPHLAVVSNQRGRSAFSQLQFALAELFVHGAAIDPALLFRHRNLEPAGRAGRELAPTTWMVNGSRALPLAAAAKPSRITPYAFITSSGHEVTAADFTADGKVAIPPSHSGFTAGREEAMVGFQHLMQQFLDTQQAVMTRYLACRQSGEVNVLPEQKLAKEQAAAPAVSTEKRTDPEGPARPDLKERLLTVVSERTGYPAEMINFDGDMEADLGIDSIKRVEILGAFMKGLDSAAISEEARAAVEKARTLHQIMTAIGRGEPVETAPAMQSPEPAVPHQQDRQAEEKETACLPRCLVTFEELPVPAASHSFPEGHAVVISDDGRGIAEALARKFSGHGVDVVLLSSGTDHPPGPWSEYVMHEDTAGLAATIKTKHGRIGGFIHLQPMHAGPSFSTMGVGQWHRQLESELKPLFELLQIFSEDLRGAGGAVVAAIYDGGGRFGLEEEQGRDIFPGHGALAGLMKTIALEWPEVRVKALDITSRQEGGADAAIIYDELFFQDPRVEIGRVGNRRYGKTCRLAPLAGDDRPVPLTPNADWVVVVTGVQPKAWISAPRVTALSTQRPVMTMSAPAARARAIGNAPR